MSTLLMFSLANAVCAALLALLALLVGRFCRRPALLHSLWLLVLLKLVTPPWWPITVADWPEEPAASVETRPEAPAKPTMYLSLSPVPPALRVQTKDRQARTLAARLRNKTDVVHLQIEKSQPVGWVEERDPTNEHGGSRNETHPTPLIFAVSQPTGLAACIPLLCLAWLAGIVVWLIWAGLHIIRFHRLLRHARRGGLEIQEQSDGLAARMGLARGPQIWLLPGPLPPLVWSTIGRARIFFPVKLLARLDNTERGSLLAHELAHVRRRDHWLRWLELIASALYWWYPLVWLARRRLHLYEEECCDAWVLGEVPARTYAGAILNTLDFLAEDRAPLPVMASGLAGAELLKRRLNLIMDGGTPKRLSAPARIALVLVGLLLLSLRPNLARTETKPSEVKDPNTKPAAQVEPVEEPTVFDAQPKNLLNQKLDSPPLAIARSPDGKTLALALEDQTVQLRDAVTGVVRFTLKGHEDAVTCVAFSPDGKTLASGSPNRRVLLWDSATGKLRRALEGHSNWIYAVAYTPDGKALASSGYDKTIRLWDAASGAARRVLKGHKASIRALAFSPDGKTLASGGGDRTIRLWPMDADGEPVVLKGHEDTIRVLVFSPDGKTLASGSDDRTIKLWDAAKKSERATLNGQASEVTTLTFSPRGKILVSGAADGAVVLWNASTGSQHSQLRGHNDAITGLLFSDSQQLLSASLDGTVKVWQAQPTPLRLLRGHTGPVASVVISRDGRRLLSGSGWPEGDRTARLWDLKTGKELRVFRAEPPMNKGTREPASQIGAVAFSPNGKQAVAAGASGVVFLWDVETGKQLRRFRGHVGEVSSLDFTPDGQHLLSGGQDKTIRLWEVKSGREVRKFEGHTDWVRSVRLRRDGKRFLSGGRDGVMRLWDVDSGKELRQFPAAPKGWTESVAWMPDNRQAVCAGGDSTVQIWDIESGARVRSFTGHVYGVTCVEVSPDGRSILSCGYDWTVRWWDAATGQQRQIFRQPGFARAVQFSLDGRYAIAAGGGQSDGGGKYVPGGTDFPIRVWSLTQEQPARAKSKN